MGCIGEMVVEYVVLVGFDLVEDVIGVVYYDGD